MRPQKSWIKLGHNLNNSDFLQNPGHVGQQIVQLSASHPVRVQRFWVQRPVPPHDHAFTELAIVQSGNARHCDGNGETELATGSVIVVPPGPVHAFRAVDELEIINVYYLSEWFLWDLNLLWQNEGLMPLFFAAHLFKRAELRRVAIFTLDDNELETCRRELCDIESESQRENPSLFWVRGAFSKLLVVLGRAWHRQQSELNDFDFRHEIWRAVEWVDAAIKEGEPFDAAVLAREVGQSSGHFSRLFRAATGLAPSDYYQRRRIQHAGHLLLRSALSVSQIAARLHFSDPAHLSRVFRKIQGQSPREFRRLYRKTNP